MSYKTDDQIREFYLNNNNNNKGDEDSCNSKNNNAQQQTSSSSSSSSSTALLPDLWETRQKERDLQAKQMGALSSSRHQEMTHMQSQTLSNNASTANSSPNNDDENEMLQPKIALVQITTNALNTMAEALETSSNRNNNNTKVEIPLKERTEFARAMKKAMDALAKQNM